MSDFRVGLQRMLCPGLVDVVSPVIGRRGQLVGGVDQRDMGNCLGKIADQPFLIGLILFREQAEIVTQR